MSDIVKRKKKPKHNMKLILENTKIGTFLE